MRFHKVLNSFQQEVSIGCEQIMDEADCPVIDKYNLRKPRTSPTPRQQLGPRLRSGALRSRRKLGGRKSRPFPGFSVPSVPLFWLS